MRVPAPTLLCLTSACVPNSTPDASSVLGRTPNLAVFDAKDVSPDDNGALSLTDWDCHAVCLDWARQTTRAVLMVGL